MSMKNSNDTNGNRTRDLPTCSAMSQPSAPPSAPYIYIYIVINWIYICIYKYIYTYVYSINHERNLPMCNIGSWQNWACYVCVTWHPFPRYCIHVYTYCSYLLFFAILMSCVTFILIPCKFKRTGFDIIKRGLSLLHTHTHTHKHTHTHTHRHTHTDTHTHTHTV